MNIHIEYCIRWNYKPEFDRVSKIIKEISPDSNIKSNRDYPRSGAFEIELNGKVVYSKFKTSSFPSKYDIQKIIENANWILY